MIKLVRIDDRLLHGQVAVGWVSATNANVIFIANDAVKNDPIKAVAMDLAKPSNVTLYIRGMDEAGEITRKFAGSTKSDVIVIVKDTKDALELVKTSGGVVKSLNVGGLRYAEGKRKLTDLVAVDDTDIANLKEIERMGVEVEFRLLPRDKKASLKDFKL